ncbi:MAG: oxidoreductase [Flavobacteriaceae bacterium]|nr:oxidoreductase [Flavobacteriaceae bacterium]|tara:strand:+ start:45042 stop:46139 length:1098 start_codon:yes stop_codon:yes gene_type:complete
MEKNKLYIISLISFLFIHFSYGQDKLNLGVIGLVHDHVNWILNYKSENIKIVGIVEKNINAINRYKKSYNLPDSIFFDSMNDLYNKRKVDAVTAFNSTYDHLKVVKFFAPKGIHIMVEKPLSVNYEIAKEMASIAKKYNISLLVNYETSWYESTYHSKTLIDNGKIGSLNKLVFNTGHQGPIEIGCTSEFLKWLTDPVLNGGGALTDFGCYGANISTWLLDGEKPLSVSCIAKSIKKEKYPLVDDDTTIILNYEKKKVIINASWNWPYNRKDMQIYGDKGYINAIDNKKMEFIKREYNSLKKINPPKISSERKDPFLLLYKVVKENYKLKPFSLYSIENNLIVSRILDLALKSSNQGKTVLWDKD